MNVASTVAWACLAVVAASVGAGLLTHAVRKNMLPRRILWTVTALCGGTLLAMILTDWPLEELNDFWAGHSVLTSLMSSLLLVGVVFLVYQHGEQSKQQRLADGLSGAGLGGLVEAVVDVEVALALLSCQEPPDQIQPQHWTGWADQGKPLRWLRHGRGILVSELDPRNTPATRGQHFPAWSQDLVDQALRRLLGAMRDWSPLIGASQDGTEVLLLLADVRADLMELRGSLAQPGSEDVAASLEGLRIRLRVLALCFESWNKAPLREEIIGTLDPLPAVPTVFKPDSRSLKKRLDAAYEALAGNQGRGRGYGAATVHAALQGHAGRASSPS